ncbi:hypothetical protein [Pseudonocardia lacus]|uniref:hypothetical protein n=1 Tax=Pseudonocardia lacus TaxID=2835865 RepID=UPI001BDD7266|nr:hypothetical protein [Pseudonocardia lacus]
MQQNTDPYRIPDDHLTAQGRVALDQVVGGWTRALHAELDRQAAPNDRRGDPEYRYTRTDVLAARDSVERNLRPDTTAERVAASQPVLLAPILVTVGSVGVGVMPHFLHSSWQWALFVVLLLIGLFGLALTWVGGTRAKRGSPPGSARVAAPTARVDG